MTPSRCIACDGPLAVRLERVEDPATRETFSVAACPDCGLGHTVPQPQDLLPYYGGGYWGKRHGPISPWTVRRRLRILGRDARPPGRLLDVGCGDGAFLAACARLGWTVAGTEIGEAARNARAAGLVVHDDLEGAASDAPFDCVTSWHSLEHLRDPRATLARVRELLAPGGVVIVSVPDGGGLQARLFGRHWAHLDVPRHLYHFDDRSLTRLLQRVGFQVRRRYHQELEYELFGWVQSALNAILPEPNVLQATVAGRPHRAGAAITALSVVLGVPCGLLSLPATALGTLTGRGGTLIAVARA